MSEWTIYSKSGAAKAVVHELEYHGEWMGDEFVTVTVKSAVPVEFHYGDYLTYRGEQFVIDYEPNFNKKAKSGSYGEAFTYDNIRLYTLARQLRTIAFKDYVLGDNNMTYSSQDKFSFFAGSVEDLADRIQANLDRTGQTWYVMTPSETRTNQRGGNNGWSQYYTEDKIIGFTDVNITCDSIKCDTALKMAYDNFGLSFIIKDRTIIIGSKSTAPIKMFEYGKGNGLAEIESSTDDSQEVVTRLYAYGSEKNLPRNYYANMFKKPYISGTKRMDPPSQEGMPAFYYIDAFSVPFSSVQNALTNPAEVIMLTNSSGTISCAAFANRNVRDGSDVQYLCIRLLNENNGVEINGQVVFGNAQNFYNAISDNERLYITYGVDINVWPTAYINQESGYDAALSINNLMLPGFPKLSLQAWVQSKINTTSGDEKAKWQDIYNKYDLSTDVKSPWVQSKNAASLGVREGTAYFDGSNESDEIFPTIEGTGADLVIVGSDVKDNGYLPEKAEESMKRFTIDVAKSILDWGTAFKSNTDEVIVSMKDGYNAGRNFKLMAVGKDTEYTGDPWKLTLEREQDTSIGRYFPYYEADNGYCQVLAGNRFVVTGIELQKSYVDAAAERLFLAALEALDDKDHVRKTLLPKIDEIYMAREHDAAVSGTSLHDKLKPGLLLGIGDNDVIEGKEDSSYSKNNLSSYIDHVTIKENGNNGIPTYDVVLRDRKEEDFRTSIEKKIVSISGGSVNVKGGLTMGQVTEVTNELYPMKKDAYNTYLSIEFFNHVFEVHGTKTYASGEVDPETQEPIMVTEEITLSPNEWPVSTAEVTYTITDIKAKYGLWTEQFLSALGKNDEGGGGSVLLEPLLSINASGLLAPTAAQDGMTVVYNSTTQKWEYGTAGGGGAFKLYDLLDVQIPQTMTQENDGQLLVYDSGVGKWKNEDDADVMSRQEVIDVWDEIFGHGGGGGSSFVTSIGLAAPTGFVVSGSPITSSGILVLDFADGYSLPSNVRQGHWDSAVSWINTHSANVAMKDWVNQNFVSIDFFNRIFQAYKSSTISDENKLLPNDITSAIDNLKIMVGTWTEQYLSALGKNDSAGGNTMLFEPLSSINESGLSAPTAAQNGMTVVYNSSTQKWQYGTAGGTDMNTVWTALAGNDSSKQISISHLSNALSDYALTSQIPKQLKNPYALTVTLNGTATSYDGSEAKSLTISTGITQDAADQRYLKLSGGALTGAVAVNGGITPYDAGNVGTASANGKLMIKRATTTADNTPNNGIVLEYGGSSTWVGQLYMSDNGSDGIYWGGWYNGERQSWKKLAFTSDLDGYVTIATAQTITGVKTFTPMQVFTGGIKIGQYEIVPDPQNGGLHVVGGLYTDTFLSALGKSDSGSEIVLNEPLASINDAGLAAHPSSSGQTIVWNGTAWVYGTAGGGGGTVTSVGMTVPTGFVVNGQPVTGSGTIGISFANGYSLPLTEDVAKGVTAYGLVNGKHFVDYVGETDVDFNFTDEHDLGGGVYQLHTRKTQTNKPMDYGILVDFESANGHLQFAAGTNDIRVRSYWWTNNPAWSAYPAWKTLAFTDSNISGNAGSATKLQTSRTIWGNSFDGTGNINGNIKYAGTKATYEMIKFVDNTTDVNGNGIAIGGGGLVAIGGGESSTVLAAQAAGGDERMLIGNDSGIEFYSNLQGGWTNRKTMTFDAYGNLNIGATDAAYHITMGSGSSYVWFDCRNASDTVANAFQLYPDYTNFSKPIKTNKIYLYKPNASNDTNAVYLEYESANSGIHLVGGGLYADTYLSALGLSSSGSGSVSSLSDLIDVNISSAIGGQGLVYDNSSSKWKNTTLFTALSYSNNVLSLTISGVTKTATIQAGSSGVTSVATGTGLTGGPITSTGTISINSTYQTYISHGESAYNSLSNYLLKTGGAMANTDLVTNMNSDLLDGRHGAEYFMIGVLATNISSNSDLNDIVSAGTYTCLSGSIASTLSHTPYTGGNFRLWHILNTGTDGNSSNQWSSQLLLAPNDGRLFIRSHSGNSFGDWKELAFLTSNVNSAAKLQTARTIWGQSFDGTSNVSGNMTGVGSVLATGKITVFDVIADANWASDNGSLRIKSTTDSNPYVLGIAVCSSGYGEIQASRQGIGTIPLVLQKKGGNVGVGTTSPSYKLDVNGTISCTSIRIGGYTITAENGGLHVNSAGLYADTYISALGLSDSGSSAFDETAMWQALGTTITAKNIALAYIQTAADTRYALKTDIPTLSNLSWSYGSVTAASGNSYNGSAARSFVIPKNTSHLVNDSRFITSSALGSYLPLTGGTLTGNLNFSHSGSVKLTLRADGEGGNINIVSPTGYTDEDGNQRFWEIDSYNGSLRFYTRVGGQTKVIFGTDGIIQSTGQGTLWGAYNDGAGSGLDADLLDGYHAANIYNAPTKSINQGNAAVDYIRIATIVIPGGSLAVAGFAAMMMSREVTERNSFILNLSIRRTNKDSISYDFVITPIGTVMPRDAYITKEHTENSNETCDTFYVYIGKASGNYAPYYKLCPLHSDGNVTFETATASGSSSAIESRVVVATAAVGGIASKLATTGSYTAWGQTYWTNGTPQNVSGNMSDVGTISATGDLTITKASNVSMKIVGTSYTFGLHLGDGGTNRGIYQWAPTNKWLLYFDQNNTVLYHGNVGIGTDSPSYKLDVNGTVRISDTFLYNSGDATMKIYKLDGQYANETVGIQTDIDGYDPETSGGTYDPSGSIVQSRCVLALQPRGGYVGIGTATPGAKLDVNGQMKALTYMTSASGTGTTGSTGWVKLATITVTGAYANQPLKFRVVQRGMVGGEITLRFSNAESASDTTVDIFSYTGFLKDPIIVKSGADFSLYVRKSESYDNIGASLVDMGAYMSGRVTVTWDMNTLTSFTTNSDGTPKMSSITGGTLATCRYYFTNSAYMEWDATNGGIHLVGGGLYADTYISALGLSSSGSSNVSALYDLVDVNISGASNGQALVYRNGIWKNETIQSGGGTVTSVATGTGLTGGTITSSGTISINSTYQTYISNGNTAYGWGNHANVGYLTQSAADLRYLKLTGGVMTGSVAFGGTDNTSYMDLSFYRNNHLSYIAPGPDNLTIAYRPSISNTNTNYILKLDSNGCTLNCTLRVATGYGIEDASTNGLLVYHPNSWTGVSSSQWGVGAANCQGVIRSDANDLKHYRGSALYNILDTYNSGIVDGHKVKLNGTSIEVPVTYYIPSPGTFTSGYWHKLGTYVTAGDASSLVLTIYNGKGYNSQAEQNSFARIVIKDGWQSTRAAKNSVGVTIERFGNYFALECRIVATADNAGAVWIYFPWQYASGTYEVSGQYTSWTHNPYTNKPEDGGPYDYEYNDGPVTNQGIDFSSSVHAYLYLDNAYKSDNVASATKLQTARTIWGQSFDGTSNVSGDMTGVGSVLATGKITVFDVIADANWASDNGSLRIKSTTDSNPYVLGIAVCSSGYGEIQASRQGIGTIPLVLQKKGGNVGIGTSSPSYKLHVNGEAMVANSIYTNGHLIMHAGSTGIYLNSSGTGIDWHNSSNQYVASVMAFSQTQVNVTASAGLKIGNAVLQYESGTNSLKLVHATNGASVNFYATGGVSALGLSSNASGQVNGDIIPSVNGIYTIGSGSKGWSDLFLADGDGATLNIYADSGEAWYSSSGRHVFEDPVVVSDYLNVNGSNASYNLYVSGKSYLTNTLCVGGTSSSYMLYVSGTSNLNGNVYVKGTLTHSSDMRMKDFVENTDIDVEAIARAPLFKFTWRDKTIDLLTHIGTSAQYWQGVAAETVTADGAGTLGLDYGVTALASVISVARKVMTHEERIAALEAENERLRNEIETLKAA